MSLLDRVLKENHVPHILIGGLASIAWGVKRPLGDIDIQVSVLDFPKVELLFINKIDTPNRHYLTDRWDIQQMILSINEVGVDVCGAENFTVVSGRERYKLKNCLGEAELRRVGNLIIPVLPKEVLMDYKRHLGRPVDLQDLTALEQLYL